MMGSAPLTLSFATPRSIWASRAVDSRRRSTLSRVRPANRRSAHTNTTPDTNSSSAAGSVRVGEIIAICPRYTTEKTADNKETITTAEISETKASTVETRRARSPEVNRRSTGTGSVRVRNQMAGASRRDIRPAMSAMLRTWTIANTPPRAAASTSAAPAWASSGTSAKGTMVLTSAEVISGVIRPVIVTNKPIAATRATRRD